MAIRFKGGLGFRCSGTFHMKTVASFRVLGWLHWIVGTGLRPWSPNFAAKEHCLRKLVLLSWSIRSRTWRFWGFRPECICEHLVEIALLVALGCSHHTHFEHSNRIWRIIAFRMRLRWLWLWFLSKEILTHDLFFGDFGEIRTCWLNSKLHHSGG